MVPADVRTALATAIAEVTGVGKVYPRRRVVKTDADVAALFMDAGTPPKINVWMVSFVPVNPVVSDKKMGFNGIGVAGGGTVMTTLTFQIEAYYGLSDATDSEETFEDLLWSVAAAINSYGKLLDPITTQHPCQVAACTYAMLVQKYLTHYARLTIAIDGRTQ